MTDIPVFLGLSILSPNLEEEDVVYLNAMGIDPEIFETSLVKEFSGNAVLFHKLMQTFRKTPANAIKTELFNDFLKSFQCPADGIVCDKLFKTLIETRFMNELRLKLSSRSLHGVYDVIKT